MELRGYQKTCIERINAAKDRGVFRPVAVLPTGAGKTIIFSSLIKNLFETAPDSRALVLAHRDELIQQAQDKLFTIWPDAQKYTGVVKAERNEVDSKITVASVQSLTRSARLEAYAGHGLPDLVVTDECQHSPAASYINLYRGLSLLPDQDIGGRLHLGVTATPDRLDKLGLNHIYDEVVHAQTINFMIESGYLVPIQGKLVGLDIDLDSVSLNFAGDDFSETSLAKVMVDPRVINAIADAWVEKGENRKTAAFVPSVQIAEDLAEVLRGKGISAESISSYTPEATRKDILRKFSDGEIQFICNVNILTEGWDEPSVDCILMARPTKSRALYQQIVGRGLRPAPWVGKADCLVLDIVGNTVRHKLVTCTSLVGLDPSENTREETEDAVEADTTPRHQKQEIPIYSGVDKVVGMLSGFGWLELKPNVHALYAYSPSRAINTAVVISPALGGGWRATAKNFNIIGSPGVQVIAEGPDRGYVFGMAEDYALLIGTDVDGLLRDDSDWRRLPPTPKQMELIKKLRSPEEQSRPYPASRGAAADLITQLRLLKMLEPATPRQVYALRKAGLWEPGLTKVEATRLIAQVKNQRWAG